MPRLGTKNYSISAPVFYYHNKELAGKDFESILLKGFDLLWDHPEDKEAFLQSEEGQILKGIFNAIRRYH